MGRLIIDVLLYNVLPKEHSGKKNDQVEGGGNESAVEAQRVQQGKALPVRDDSESVAYDSEVVRVRIEKIDLMQSTYNIRRASYDFHGLCIEFFQPVDESVLGKYLENEERKFKLKNSAVKDAGGPEQKYEKLEYDDKKRKEFPEKIWLKNFSLYNQSHIQSLEYLIGLINADIMDRKIPQSALSSEDVSTLAIIREIQLSVEKAMTETFHESPAHFGLAFLQNSLVPPIIVRVTEKISFGGAVAHMLCLQSPICRISDTWKNKYDDKILDMLSHVSPATIRLDQEGILLLEQMLNVPGGLDVTADIAIVLSDFNRIAEGLAELVRSSMPQAENVTQNQIENFFRLPLSTELDLKHSDLKWGYLIGRAKIEQLSNTTGDPGTIHKFIEQIENPDVRDQLLSDQILTYGRKRMTGEAIKLIEKISAPDHKVFAIRILAEIFCEQNDKGALNEIMTMAVNLLGSIDVFQVKLSMYIRDMIFIFIEKLGWKSVLSSYPEQGSAQVRLACLSAIVRSSGIRAEKDEMGWISYYTGLAQEIEVSPRLFLPLMDELIDLVYALAAIPSWRKYVDDFVRRLRRVAELSVHKDYYLYRLSAV